MRFTLSLPHDADSICTARHALDVLAPEVDDLTLRNARLLVSEIVTNAVRYADGVIELVVAEKDGALHVEVVDRGPGFQPSDREPGQDPGSGWGLQILARLATRWGVERDGGARVWFELEGSAAAPDQR
jgi:anti-sigma regulatory factor (Ser/Thr protein kinase)